MLEAIYTLPRQTPGSEARHEQNNLPPAVTNRRGVGARIASAATTSPTPSPISTATTTAAAVTSHLIEARVNLLLGLQEDLYQITSIFSILGGEERDGGAVRTSTSSSANAVNIVFRVVRIVIVKDVSNITDVWCAQNYS